VPSVADLSAPYGNFMRGPRPGPDVCRVCFNLTDGYGRCYACAHGGRWLDAIVPISYSVAGGQLHHALASYKRRRDVVGHRFGLELAAVLWRYLVAHEACVRRAAGVDAFAVVTTVPSSDAAADDVHPLHAMVAELVGPVRDRYARLLRRSATPSSVHEFNARKFETGADLAGRAVLLVDDTWTTGANAQSAAAALKAAGASRVAAVVIGRYLNRDWPENERRLRSLPEPYDWSSCALCAARGEEAEATATPQSQQPHE
jgi:predicted amidophosphoribosyltransferase